MALTRPTLQQITDRIRADITQGMGSQATILRRAFVTIFGRALAGAVHLLYGYAAWMYRQFFAVTAEREALLMKGAVYGLYLKPAEYAIGRIDTSGTVGAVIPKGTVFLRSDSFRYTTEVDTTLSGVSTSVAVRASLPGSAGTVPAGELVALESPIAGIDTEAEVSAAGITGGYDEEDIEEFRKRYMFRIQNPAQGGSAADYKSWALEVSGVGDAFVYVPSGIKGSDGTVPPEPPFGSVWIYIRSSDPEHPEPSAELVNSTQLYIETKKTATATIRVDGIVQVPIDFDIRLEPVPGSSINDADREVKAELKDLLLRSATPKTTIRISQINEAISGALSENFHQLLSPAADIELAHNEVAVVGTVTVNPF